MHKHIKKTFFGLLLIASFFIVSTAHAQVDVLGLNASDVTVSTSPESPRANTNVVVMLSSYSIELNTATIIWKKDGETIKTGIGAKSITLKTGAVGSYITLDIQIISGADSLTKNILIQPSEVDLLWEAIDSYVPPFYKGKALGTEESNIKVIAIPNVNNTNNTQGNMIYTWEKNYIASPSNSGYNKNSMVQRLDYLNPKEIVKVSVSSLDRNYEAENTIELKPSRPRILYYQNNPDLGLLLNSSIANGTSTTRSDFEVFAIPLFFTLKNLAKNDLTYAWSVGGKSIPDNSVKNRITVQFPKNSSGPTDITTKIESKLKLFQTAQSSVSITKK
jgi:hypothetical protein